MNQRQTILICPLEWGLGHAARMIPVARKLVAMNHRVIIGSGRQHLALFLQEMPGIETIDFAGFSTGYSKRLPQYLALLCKIPRLIYNIIKEHHRIRKIVRENKINIVISDNRFGLWTKVARTVYITHMPVIPFPPELSFLEFIGIYLHRWIMKKYDFCFIPDLPGEINVSGRLSHGVRLPINTRFIGILSRFTDIIPDEKNNPVRFRHTTVILSGPEPQREILKKQLTVIFKKKKSHVVFLGGYPDKKEAREESDNIFYFNHLRATVMKEVLSESEGIITRSGYTTIMELISINRSALLIPTPGQTEQEYLAEYLAGKDWFTAVKQKDLSSDLPPVPVERSFPEQIIKESRYLLDKALTELSEY